jgi:hypothetical protein
MLTNADCRSLAELHFAQISRQCAADLTLLPKTFETALTLAYFYQATDYLTTGDASQALAGNGPILVSKLTGAVGRAGTALPIEEYIESSRLKPRHPLRVAIRHCKVQQAARYVCLSSGVSPCRFCRAYSSLITALNGGSRR